MAPSVEESSRSRFIRLRGTFVLLLLHAVLGVAPEKLTSDVGDYRLPTSVYPLHYDLEIQPYMSYPDPALFTYRGSVKITVRCNIRTKRIVLHLNGPTVDPTSIAYYLEGSNIRQGYDLLKEDQKRQFFIITLDGYLQVGNNYTIEMNFTAPLQKKPVGFYYSSYGNNNDTEYVAATQFKPIYARNAFPCFDEPAMKATFSVSIVRPSNGYSLSNMPIVKSIDEIEESGISYTKDIYRKTPRIPIFALSFVVCDYNYVSKISQSDVPLKAYTRKQYRWDVSHLLDYSDKVRAYHAGIFGNTSLVPKQDFVGISEFELAPGWGLHIAKESQMVYNAQNYTSKDEMNVARMVSYTSAHQFFSSLVTPSWWTDLWLMEGLSRYFEDDGVAGIDTFHKHINYIYIDYLNEALMLDADFSSRPIYTDVHTTSAIKDRLDSFNYIKARWLVSMIRFSLGKSIFHAAIRNYIEKYSYKTATTRDFLHEMDEAAKNSNLSISITDMMETWLLQPNYPLVTVQRDFNDPSIIHVTQERFLADPTAKDPGTNVSPFNFLWSIPLAFTSSEISIRVEQDHTDVYWLYKEERAKDISFTRALPGCNDTDGWILANIFKSFCRINYQTGNWLAIGRQLKTDHLKFRSTTRARTIDDVWNLAKAGYVSIKIALSLVEYLGAEEHFSPWSAAWNELRYVDLMLGYTSLYGPFKKFMRDILRPRFEAWGVHKVTSTEFHKYTQALVTQLACQYRIATCVDVSKREYQQLMGNPDNNTILPDLRQPIYCGAIASGGWDEWRFALEMYKNTEHYPTQEAILTAMACTNQPWILNYFLRMLLDKNFLCSERHAFTIITEVAMNPKGRFLAWDFYREHYDVLKQRYPHLQCSTALPTIVKYFSTQLELKEATTFGLEQCSDFDKSKFQLRVIDKIKTNILWRDRNFIVIKTWMKEKGYLNVSSLT